MTPTRRIFGRMICLLVLAGLCAAVPLAAEAAVTAAQRRTIDGIRKSIIKAGNLFVQKKFEASGDSIKQAQESVQKMASDADPELLKALQPLVTRLGRAHALLELEGIKLPPLTDLKKRTKDKPAPMPDGGAISFTKHVAPILIVKCGRCHVQRANGMFSMATFSNLMKGSDAGVVLFAGDAADSRMVELIENGDMPRGNLKVAPAELAALIQWINAGAKYDGADPEESLVNLAPDAKPAVAAKLTVMQATGKETVSFANDIAPVLNKSCANCHGNGRRASGRFNLTTFQNMLRGGESGAPVAPGKPADSLLVKMLKGTAGSQRMPAKQPPLADEVIAKIETWIKEGATFDGPNPGQHIREVAALGKARRSTHEQLSADRRETAAKNWNLGMPGIDADQVETKDFLLMGDIGEKTLASYGELAESIVPKIGNLMKLPADQPLIKGRMTLFLFRQRYDYSEFGKMVEKRQLPKAWRGHWRFSVVDAYAGLIVPRNDEYSLEALLAQQIAGAYVGSLGSVPNWFSEGSGRSAAASLYPDDPRVASWDATLSGVLGAMTQADDFLTGKLSPADASIAAYSFVKFLQGDRKRYDKLLRSVRDGQEFALSFSDIYGGSPAQLAGRWAASASRRRR